MSICFRLFRGVPVFRDVPVFPVLVHAVRTGNLEISRCHLADYVQEFVLKCVPHVQQDYFSSFNTFRAGRSACQQGFFLRGVYRSNGNSLGHIEWGKCCKPSHHPYHWGDCYNEDVSGTFNKAGLSECRRDGYFITGFETTSGGALSTIKKFKCCRMVEGK